jgi:L-cysteine desulfidase
MKKIYIKEALLMDKKLYDAYLHILKSELVVALGCTEPIAIAFAGAKARELLGEEPVRCEVLCSGNIVKNVKGVTVPNSGGMKGIEVAATLGIVGGDADRELAVLESVKKEDIKKTKSLLKSGFCSCGLIEGVENLYIIVRLWSDENSSEVEIKDYHSNITRLVKNGEELLTNYRSGSNNAVRKPDKSLLNVKDILEFADCVSIADVEPVLARQVEYNSAISVEGLKNSYGAEVGRTLLSDSEGAGVKLKAKAAAAAGSDARMSGCPMPVVINSGSGNQGITVTMPVVVYARELSSTKDQLYRALVVSNLISIHQKKYIGSLSAYCGAVSAACGSGAAIAYLLGATYDEICSTITNTIANIGGMVCDGAKPSCAAKIASAVDAALMAYNMSKRNTSFRPGEGLVKEDVEKTIESIGRMAREGMRSTDVEILNIMLDK